MTKREMEAELKRLADRVRDLEARPVFVPYQPQPVMPMPPFMPSTAQPPPIQPQWWYQYPAIGSLSGVLTGTGPQNLNGGIYS